MINNKYVVKSLLISNFKPFPYSNPPIKISFTDMSDRIIQFMMLSGFNGYGKTSIFQAIEFAISGKIEIKEFKDTTQKYSEHIMINQLGKESLIVLEIFNPCLNKIISIIRYNPNVKSCKESECKRGFKGFDVYIEEGTFDYNTFIDKKNKKEITKKTDEQVADLIGEKDIKEWLNINYIKQENIYNLLFKTNSERVSFVNQFIDKGYDEYFLKFDSEMQNNNNSISQVESELITLKRNLENSRVNNIGEEPENIKLFKDSILIWDKEKYEDDEEFEKYINVLKNIKTFCENFDCYNIKDKIFKIEDLLNNTEILKQVIFYNCYGNSVDIYRENNKKVTYLKEMIKDKKEIIKKDINEEYLSTELIQKINDIRDNENTINKLLDNKQKLYIEIKELREKVLSNTDEFEDVFNDVCPLCGSKYGNSKNLIQAIKQYCKNFEQCNDILTDTINKLSDNFDIMFKEISKNIEESISKIDYDQVVFDEINKFDNNIEQIKEYKSDLELLANKIILNILNSKKIDSNNIESIITNVKNELIKIKEQYISDYSNELEKYEEDTFKRNKWSLHILRSKDINNFLKDIDIKIDYLKWRYSNQQFNNFTKYTKELKEKSEQLREMLIKQIKLQKVIEKLKEAKNKYMDDLIGHIEIPLYIYSGKLMQTHQNGLGVFCTTGPSDKVTQFKLTTNGDGSVHDILNKFSSGQKAVINIATMLAFRKIKKSNFDLFMIDDPCQSMDDINIASLTDILRNEFRDSQIIVSTHEDSTAGYMCYKYYKSGNISRNFNVQKELYNIEK